MLDSHPLQVYPGHRGLSATMSFVVMSLFYRVTRNLSRERLKKEAGLAREDTISKIKKKSHEAFSF